MNQQVQDYLDENQSYLKDITSHYRPMLEYLLATHDIILHDDIIYEYKGLCVRTITDEITKKFGLPLDIVLESVEEINLDKYLGVDE